jgi:hypothetical protein
MIFPDDPVFYELPNDLTENFLCPNELDSSSILFFSKYWFNVSQTKENQVNGNFKNLVFKSFFIWCLERDGQRVVMIQGNNKNNFYVLAYFDETVNGEKDKYKSFLFKLENSYAEKNKIN